MQASTWARTSSSFMPGNRPMRMSKVHQDGTDGVQSPPSILLTTKLIGCSWPAKAS
jgi:hypothetical protein